MSTVSAASEANEDLTRALIVIRLINHVQWQQADFSQKSSEEFQLCIFDDSRTYRLFSHNLKGVEINKLSIKVKNISQVEKVSSCHALYIPKPNNNVIEWLIDNNAQNKTVLVTEKKGHGDKGAHFNINLDEEGFFDFEFNPDAFENSSHDIAAELLTLGKVIRGNVALKTKTLRTLINNTEWPQGKVITSEFKLCAYPNNAFATFAEYFLRDSDLAGKKVKLIKLSPSNLFGQLTKCNALLLGENDKVRLNWLMEQRKELGILIISNALNSENNGAHYSLKFHNDIQSRRFAINLIAFGITGHIPNYQLFNSAIMVKNDYPLISELLTQIIEQTQWPEGTVFTSTKEGARLLSFCNYQSDVDLLNLRYFLPDKLPNNQQVVYKEFKDLSLNNKCDVIFSGSLSKGSDNYLFIKKKYPKALLVTNQLSAIEKTANQSLIHFNLSLKPKIITIEAFLNNIKNSRFNLDKKLFNSVEIVGGNSND